MTTMKSISQVRARMLQTEAPKRTPIRYTREELLALRDVSLGLVASPPVSPEPRDQLFSVENLLKFANKPAIEPVEPELVLPQLLSVQADKEEEERVLQSQAPISRTTKSYLSLAKPLAKHSPELASKLRDIIGGGQEQSSKVEHSVNIPIVINAGSLGQFQLNACAKLSIKINLDIEGLRKSQLLEDPEQRRAFIRQQIHMDTSDCQLTIQ